jgi:hypothetical protein
VVSAIYKATFLSKSAIETKASSGIISIRRPADAQSLWVLRADCQRM